MLSLSKTVNAPDSGHKPYADNRNSEDIFKLDRLRLNVVKQKENRPKLVSKSL